MDIIDQVGEEFMMLIDQVLDQVLEVNYARVFD